MLFRCFIAVLCFAVSACAAEAQARPLRVVSLAPNLTELVFELGFGSNLVGRSSACDYPPEAKQVPVVGGFGRPNWEMMESLRPDLVLATDLEKPGLLDRLKEMGVQTLLLPCESWDQLMQAGLAICGAFDQRVVGEKFVHSMKVRREGIEGRVARFYGDKPRPRVYVEVWGDPLTTAGGGSFMDDLIRLAGGTNIAAGLSPQYVHVSTEWIIGQDPDVILLAYMLPKASSAESVVKRPGWDKMRAVRGNAICENIPPDLLLRPGPRMLDGAEKFAEWMMGYAAVSNEQLTTDN
jgi:iron complex transport system substrate-binding protein